MGKKTVIKITKEAGKPDKVEQATSFRELVRGVRTPRQRVKPPKIKI